MEDKQNEARQEVELTDQETEQVTGGVGHPRPPKEKFGIVDSTDEQKTEPSIEAHFI